MKKTQSFDFDISEIIGQEAAKRALQIAAAGSHNIIMNGPPGAGKTLLARTLPSILPKLTKSESLELSSIYSLSGHIPANAGIITSRPFRNPHHTISRIAIIGGGSKPKVGEITLSHRGVLFLDEFPKFPRSILESLRQPIEDGQVQISRVAGTVMYPCKFILVAAANPCSCGYYGSAKQECTCSAREIKKYQQKISGPIIDRIDLQIIVPEVKVKKLIEGSQKTTVKKQSSQIQDIIQAARDRQSKRFTKLGLKINSNAELSTKDINKYCKLDALSLKLLHQAVDNLSLSARAYYKVIKIARTIADLAGVENIKADHIAEALQYRLKHEP